MNPAYVAAAERLVERILALIPTRPEILTLDSPWGLFKVPGFECSDLDPSLAQAGWALAEAKIRHRAQTGGGT